MKLHTKIKMVQNEFEMLWREQDRKNMPPLERLKQEFRKREQNLLKIEAFWQAIDWSTVPEADKSALERLKRNAQNRQER